MAHEDDDEPTSTSGDDTRDDKMDDGAGLGDTVRKMFGAGWRAARAGQKKIRGIVEDAVPDEVMGYVKGAIDTGRDELVRIIGAQFKQLLEGIDVGGEVAKILTAVSFEIKTEIRFIPNDKKIKPEVKVSVRPKKADKDEPDES